ncbi:Planctomycete cytochrome C [Pirellula sp. SH-Sr6A]|uniref:DUF1553 domain-containing protein n=1 Tax=Pirellula sp. SH-Sr6A TaxID=1632865 RepID=UPI00078E6296|nr:DUF1553 domain-containing protein [Pirellula sp. SH-Sr6A]AMV34741.1 Planctomycete cytochrome C [Pirellula sp. SH-Sr6A]
MECFLAGCIVWGISFVIFLAPAVAQQPPLDTAPIDIAPILREHCIGCHAGSDPQGGLDLTTRAHAEAGSDSGPVLESDSPLQSLLWQVVERDEMPPKKPLNAETKRLLKQWLSEGAIWPDVPIDPMALSNSSRAGLDWWSLQPLRSVDFTNEQFDAPTGLDFWIDRQLREKNLERSPESDRRTLLRRLHLDLTGLPPSQELLDRFLADESPDAYERVVDELLASPHYGERWGRHWLDVVRFGETNGFEYDEPRDHFWHFRNWVIRSLNQDMPYDEFVRWQLAGDALFSDPVQGAEATGFLVAGPHNTTLPAGNPLMRLAMQQDELEELVGVVGQTFLGLTVQCARCHDHKFDPISQQNYYEFAATLSGVRHGEKSLSEPLEQELVQKQEQIRTAMVAIDSEIHSLLQQTARTLLQKDGLTEGAPHPLPIPRVGWSATDLELEKDSPLKWTPHGKVTRGDGFAAFDGSGGYLASPPFELRGDSKTLTAWVQLSDLSQSGGGIVSLQTLNGSQFDALVFGERSPREWMAGSNNFVRTRAVQGEKEGSALNTPVHLAITYAPDGTIQIYRNGARYGIDYRTPEKLPTQGVPLQLLVGLRHTPPGGNRSLHGKVFQAALFDRLLTEEELRWLASDPKRAIASTEQMIAGQSIEVREQIQSLEGRRAQLQSELAKLADTKRRVFYTHTGNSVETNRIFFRGEVASPGPLVEPNGLHAVKWPGSDPSFRASKTEADRRAAVARWITDSQNGLFARVMVNRVWHYHFGSGLIPTPNDFGFQGGVPSHPDLLEHLARQFKEEGFRLKPLHRSIVLSATYRQSSKLRENAKQLDTDNRWLWRFSPKRLDAEEVRDTLLAISHRLNREVGGIGYRDTQHAFVKGTHTYTAINESEIPFLRRTVYRFSARGGRNPLLDTFDCPDPSVATPKRAETTTPLQSLALLNNPLLFSISQSIAHPPNLSPDTLDSPASVQRAIDRVYRKVLLRDPEPEERANASNFVTKHGLVPLVRVLLNSNEFLYVR